MTNIFKWLGTFLTIGGALMTAIDVDPLNIYLFNVGAIFWLVASIRMRDNALIVLNASLLLISVMGVILRIET